MNMANLFELMNDCRPIPPPCGVKIKPCSVSIGSLKHVMLGKVMVGHKEARDKERPVSREMGGLSRPQPQANIQRSDARSRNPPKEHILCRSEGMIRADVSQRVSSFTIPKKKRANKGLLVDIPLTSRECHQEVLPNLVKSYRHPSSQGAFSYTALKSVNNKELLNKFLAKRRELRQSGYSDKELLDSYAFLYVSTQEEVETICRDGLQVGNCSVTCVGHPEMGVQLCRYSDILQQEPMQYGQTGYIIIFKVMKGKIKFVTENRGSVSLEPAPNFDCHISKSAATETTVVSPAREYESSQIYLYEYGDLEVVPFPSHLCPVFVVSFTYTGVNREIKSSTKPLGFPPARSSTCSQSNHRASVVAAGSATNSILAPPSATSLGTSISTSRLSLRTPLPTAPRQDDNGTVVWSGSLTATSSFSCEVDLVSNSSNLKPAQLGNSVNISKRMKRDAAKTHFFSQVKCLRRNADVFSNSQYYSVCYMRPRMDNSTSKFCAMVKYFSKTDSVGLVYLGGSNVLVITPIGKLTEDLGLSHDGDLNCQMPCLFISEKPRRHLLRAIRASKTTGLQLNTIPCCPGPKELPPAQKIHHSISWSSAEEVSSKSKNSPLPDHDIGFLPACPSEFLVGKTVLHDLFAEQILIQRQHNCITGALHVPSKLYQQKVETSSLIKSQGDLAKVVDAKPVTPNTGEDDDETKVMEKDMKLSCYTSRPHIEMSPTIISPDTTCQDQDAKVNPFTLAMTSEPTLEGAVSSTVSDSAVLASPDVLTDELAEKIVRGFRLGNLRGFPSASRVNPRDPRKRKLLESQKAKPGPNGLSVPYECECAKKKCQVADQTSSVIIEDQELKKATAVAFSESKPTLVDSDQCSFSPELFDQSNPADETEQCLIPTKHSATGDNVASKEDPSQPVKEPEVASTALAMRALLDSGLEDPSLKVNDCSGDEQDFEEPSWEEISNALDRRLLFSHKGDKVSKEGDKSSDFLPGKTGLRITISNKNKNPAISSASGMKSFLNRLVSSGNPEDKTQGTSRRSEPSTTSPRNGVRSPNHNDAETGAKHESVHIKGPLLSQTKSPCLKANATVLTEKLTPKGTVKKSGHKANLRSSCTNDLPKADADCLSTSSTKGTEQLSALGSVGLQKEIPGAFDQTVFGNQQDFPDTKLCQRQPICDMFPGSSCSKTIPAGFFSDAQCLISVPKDNSSVVFEEDFVLSDLVGNRKTTDLLVFLTNVAQKYNHFVGDYFKQAGLDDLVLNSGHVTPRTISVGILYPDMTVTLQNDSEGPFSVEVCVCDVLHGKATKKLDRQTLSDASDSMIIQALIHARGFGKATDRQGHRQVQSMESLLRENIGLKQKESHQDRAGFKDMSHDGQHHPKTVFEPCDTALKIKAAMKETDMGTVSLMSSATDREGAESKGSPGNTEQASPMSSPDSRADIHVPPACYKDQSPACGGAAQSSDTDSKVDNKSRAVSQSVRHKQSLGADIATKNQICDIKMAENLDRVKTLKENSTPNVFLRKDLVNEKVAVPWDVEQLHVSAHLQVNEKCSTTESTRTSLLSSSDTGKNTECSRDKNLQCALPIQTSVLSHKTVSVPQSGITSPEQDHLHNCSPVDAKTNAGPASISDVLKIKQENSDVPEPNSTDHQKNIKNHVDYRQLKTKSKGEISAEEQIQSKGEISAEEQIAKLPILGKHLDEKPLIKDEDRCVDNSGQSLQSSCRTDKGLAGRHFSKVPGDVNKKAVPKNVSGSKMARHNFMIKCMQQWSNIPNKSAEGKGKNFMNQDEATFEEPQKQKDLNTSPPLGGNKVMPPVKFKRTFQTIETPKSVECAINNLPVQSPMTSAKFCRTFLPPKIHFSQLPSSSKQHTENDLYDMVDIAETEEPGGARRVEQTLGTEDIFPVIYSPSSCGMQVEQAKGKLSRDRKTCVPKRVMEQTNNCVRLGTDSEYPARKEGTTNSFTVINCPMLSAEGNVRLTSSPSQIEVVRETSGNMKKPFTQNVGIAFPPSDHCETGSNPSGMTDVREKQSCFLSCEVTKSGDSIPISNTGMELYDPFDLDQRSSPSPPCCLTAATTSPVTNLQTLGSANQVREAISIELGIPLDVGTSLMDPREQLPKAKTTGEKEVSADNMGSAPLVEYLSWHGGRESPKSVSSLQTSHLLPRIEEANSDPTASHTTKGISNSFPGVRHQTFRNMQEEMERQNTSIQRGLSWGEDADPFLLDVGKGSDEKPSTIWIKSMRSNSSSDSSRVVLIGGKGYEKNVSTEPVVSANVTEDVPKPAMKRVRSESLWDKPSKAHRITSSRERKKASVLQTEPSSRYGASQFLQQTSPECHYMEKEDRLYPVVTESDKVKSQSAPRAILPAGGGILIPEDSVYLECSPGDLELILKHLEKLKDMGCYWSMKVHSQQICKLASKRRIFKVGSPANLQATGVLKLLTQFIKCGVVELLKQHSCDSTPFPSIQQLEACARCLEKQLCSEGQQAVLIMKTGEENTEQFRSEDSLQKSSILALLSACAGL